LATQSALLVKGPNVMMGYWNNPEATSAMIDANGWLNTGDTAHISETGHIYITGRLKEIIVLSNGEKMPPADMEAAIMHDPLIDQVMIYGEGKPYLVALAVLNPEVWIQIAAKVGVRHDYAGIADRQQCGSQGIAAHCAQYQQLPRLCQGASRVAVAGAVDYRERHAHADAEAQTPHGIAKQFASNRSKNFTRDTEP
jgi:acyl-CoA synthetase (AMP-forming)/AMP-acid ligase II